MTKNELKLLRFMLFKYIFTNQTDNDILIAAIKSLHSEITEEIEKCE